MSERTYTKAEVAKLIEERDGYLKQLQDDPLVGEMAALKARCAAMLEEAANDAEDQNKFPMSKGIARRIRALIPTDYAEALAERINAAEQEGYDECNRAHAETHDSIEESFAKEMAERVRKAVLAEAEWWALRTGFYNLREGTEQGRRLTALRAWRASYPPKEGE